MINLQCNDSLKGKYQEKNLIEFYKYLPSDEYTQLKSHAHELLAVFVSTYACETEKAMAPPSSTLAWKIPWMEEAGELQSMGSLRVGHTERLHFHFSLSCTGEGNGNPLQ